MNIHKNTIVIRLTHEQVFMHKSFADSRYKRRVEKVIITQPTEADWAEYRKAKEAHDYLLDSPYFEDGGPDERSSVTEPEPTREYIYAETVEEWLARCHEIEKEEQ